jgi:Domain of Unknown Function with PDB structure (DUF3857)/Transglutaminase-like superfamily
MKYRARPLSSLLKFKPLCLLLIAFLAYPLQAAAKPDSVPDWVRSAASQTVPSYPPETNAVVLQEAITYSVGSDGKAEKNVRRVVKILRPQGRSEAKIGVHFDKDTKIVTMRVWTIGADGHEYAMKDNEYTDIGVSEEGIAFADDKYRTATAPAADPGAVIAYEYTQKTRPFVTEETWFFQENIPHLNQSFTLQLPPGFTYGSSWAHHKPEQAADLEGKGWEWGLKDVPAVDLRQVPMSPAPEALMGRMTVHYAGAGLGPATDGTWSGMGRWYEVLAKDRLQSTPEIAAKATELTSGKSDFYDKTEAIAEFVQKQIRYVAIEVGVGGYQPHAAADVFHNRYGDCKDKATLVSAMLSSIGVHSALMMVDTERGVIDPDAPSLVGNHMIAAIEIPASYSSPKLRSIVTAKTGRHYLIFDPTWELTPFGQLESNLQGSYGILLEGADTQAIQLPLMDPTLNTIHRTASFQLLADGSLKGAVTEKRFGDLAETRREVYKVGDAKQQREYLDHVLERDFTTFTATDIKVENTDSLNKDFTMTYALSAEKYARTMGQLLMVRPRVLGILGMSPDRKKRTVPIDLEETMQANDDYSIDLPSGYAVDEIPDPVSVDLGFAAYSSKTEVKGSTLHYTRTYTVREVTLPADRYADVQKLAGIIEADEQSRAVLKKQ